MFINNLIFINIVIAAIFKKLFSNEVTNSRVRSFYFELDYCLSNPIIYKEKLKTEIEQYDNFYSRLEDNFNEMKQYLHSIDINDNNSAEKLLDELGSFIEHTVQFQYDFLNSISQTLFAEQRFEKYEGNDILQPVMALEAKLSFKKFTFYHNFIPMYIEVCDKDKGLLEEKMKTYVFKGKNTWPNSVVNILESISIKFKEKFDKCVEGQNMFKKLMFKYNLFDCLSI